MTQVLTNRFYLCKIKIEYDSQKDVNYWCKMLNIKTKDTKYENFIELKLQSSLESKEKLLNNIKIVEKCVILNENIYIEEENFQKKENKVEKFYAIICTNFKLLKESWKKLVKILEILNKK